MKDLRKVKDHTDFVTFPAMHTRDTQCKHDVQCRQKVHSEQLNMMKMFCLHRGRWRDS